MSAESLGAAGPPMGVRPPPEPESPPPEPESPPRPESVWPALASGLEARMAEALALYYRDGLDMAQIGRLWGCSREWVRQVLKRARAEVAARKLLPEE